MTILSNRIDLLYFFDCQDGNPNGDPDAGNMPRVDPETMQGLVSDVCQKRKVRDYVYWRNLEDGKPKKGFDIFFGHGCLPLARVPSLNELIKDRYWDFMTPDEKNQAERLSIVTVVDSDTEDDGSDGEEAEEGLEEKKKSKGKSGSKDAAKKFLADLQKKYGVSVRDRLCLDRFDVRTFGAVLSTGIGKGISGNAGQLRGPVQCTFARSVDKILPFETTITRGSVTQEGTDTNRTMGKKNLVPYGLYRSHWFISPQLASQTKFSTDDLGVLLQSLLGMWELDRSAARGTMTARQLIVFKHQCAFGNARAQSLFDLVENNIKKPSAAPRAYSDYAFPSMDDLKAKLPTGVDAFSLTDDATIQAFIQTLT